MSIRRRTHDDDAVEAALRGDAAGLEPTLAVLAAEIAAARAEILAAAPVEPTAELAALLDRGLPPVPAPAARRWAPRLAALTAAQLTGLGLGAKLATAATVAAVGVTGVAAGGALPGPAQQVVSDVIGAVSPFEVPDGDDSSTVLRPVIEKPTPPAGDSTQLPPTPAARGAAPTAAPSASPATPARRAEPSGSGPATPAQPAEPARPARTPDGRAPAAPPHPGKAGQPPRPAGAADRPTPGANPTRTPDAAAGDDISDDRTSGAGAGADARSTTE